MAVVKNFLKDSLPPVTGECFEKWQSIRNLVIERIVSSDQVDTAEQVLPQDEWVMVMQGRAQLQMSGETFELTSGDTLLIPSGCAHSVVSAERGTVWLALHLFQDSLPNE